MSCPTTPKLTARYFTPSVASSTINPLRHSGRGIPWDDAVFLAGTHDARATADPCSRSVSASPACDISPAHVCQTQSSHATHICVFLTNEQLLFGATENLLKRKTCIVLPFNATSLRVEYSLDTRLMDTYTIEADDQWSCNLPPWGTFSKSWGSIELSTWGTYRSS